ncbi:MAG TPA: MaoC family dehydratase N-terminal domain-containing protein [Ramlibacter sp.]|nr:MaoC family dehydratase N-terminal domain-containing protein [Ramlibacter sp.]
MKRDHAPVTGTALPPLDKPRFTAAHIVRWMAAQQNWDRIHFDQAFCRDIAKLEAPVINGALKQHLIVQFLARALPGAWPWRVDYRFTGPDVVGHKLQVRGATGASHVAGGRTFLEVQLQIFNLDSGQVTTSGHAVVVLPHDGQPVLDALDLAAPEGLALPLDAAAPDAAAPAHINARLGAELDVRESRYPLDLSRLRLFADAVMELDPAHYDPAAPSPWGCVVAPPLFPLHGLEALPGAYPLGEAPDAQGREGVNEVGRDLGPLFGFSAAGGMNAGNRVQVHSLARVGERICARSTLVGARRRTGPRGGDMLFLESLNRYSEAGGRPLLTERQTAVLRLV